MTQIAVTGLGMLSPAGIGPASFFDALDSAQGAIGGSDHGPLGRIGDFGAREHIAPASLRRLPRLSQLVIVAAKQALAEAQLPYDSARIGVVLGTGLGTLAETVAFMRGYLEGGPENASPLLFPSSVMNAAAGQLALECALRGPNTTVNHRDASALAALGLGCDLLALGRADALLVGAADELSEPALHGYRRFGISPTRMRPYDRTRDGLIPGEAATILVLERREDADRRAARVRAVVGGRAESSERRPRVGVGGPTGFREAVGVVARAAAGAEVSWVAGAGNGTALDEHELEALGEGLGVLPPVSSVLALTGECFSSALLRVAAAIYALERQRIPGTVGLIEPLPRFAKALPTAVRPARVRRVLVPSFAQGGANAAVVLESGVS